MAELTEAQKERMIILLARFRGPAEVAVQMREEFDMPEPLSIAQIVKYDPTRPSYEAGDKWLPIFEAARQAYIEEVKTVPVANQGFRLQLLQEGIMEARKRKNWKLVAELSEQAAKEVGGILTNSRELNINDGRRARDMSPDDRMSMFASALAEALDNRRSKQPAPEITQTLQ